MGDALPSAKSVQTPGERERLRRVIAERNLCGLANDTKWDEFIEGIRTRPNWQPSYRYKCIDGLPSSWDVEWFYHLPFPMLSVEWFDVCHLQEVRVHRLPVRKEIIDHSVWIEESLNLIGLDYCKGKNMIRIFGYSPRSMELFDD